MSNEIDRRAIRIYGMHVAIEALEAHRGEITDPAMVDEFYVACDPGFTRALDVLREALNSALNPVDEAVVARFHELRTSS